MVSQMPVIQVFVSSFRLFNPAIDDMSMSVRLRRVANQVGCTQIDSYLMDTHVRADATCEPISTKNQTCMNVISSTFFCYPANIKQSVKGRLKGEWQER